MGIFEVGIKAFLHYDIAMRAYEGHRVKRSGLNKNGPHMVIYLKVWSLMRDTTWEGLEDMACWSRCGLVDESISLRLGLGISKA